MRLDKFARVKAKHPQLASMLERVADYVANRVSAHVRTVSPKLVAVALGVSEAEALGLLMLLEQAKLLKHRYEVRCRFSKVVIGSVEDKRDLRHLFGCHECDQEHDIEDVEVELVFDVVEGERGISGAAA